MGRSCPSTLGAVCRHSLHLQTKRARPKKADAQGHDPFLSGCICSEGLVRADAQGHQPTYLHARLTSSIATFQKTLD